MFFGLNLTFVASSWPPFFGGELPVVQNYIQLSMHLFIYLFTIRKLYIKKSTVFFLSFSDKMTAASKKKTFFKYTEEDLQNALKEIQKKTCGTREAERKYNVPHGTLINKLKGTTPIKRGVISAPTLLKTVFQATSGSKDFWTDIPNWICAMQNPSIWQELVWQSNQLKTATIN